MNTETAVRRAARAVAAFTPVVLLLVAAPAMADTPKAWGDSEADSFLIATLKLGGSAVALGLIITVLVLAPSFIRRDRQQRGVASWTEPEWFGSTSDAAPAGAGGSSAAPEKAEETEDTGGASARW